MKEFALRDLIAQDISRLKAGLSLLKKEQYIPNEYGTNGFIDLYAKDEKGLHVLVEIKRSTAASRQAIHEVIKYAEGVKQYFGAKDEEIHIVIASTEWEELIIPFSRFVADCGFSVEGINIIVDECSADFQTEQVTPLPVTMGRVIAPWHNVYWYKDRDALEHGICSVENAYKQKGVQDYVIVVFRVGEEPDEDNRRKLIRAEAARLVGVGADELKLPEFGEIPAYEYIAYTALQTLSEEACLEILAGDADQREEAANTIAHMDMGESLCYLHEKIEQLAPAPKCDYCEIGYPAKFSKLCSMECCTVCDVLRYGIFKRNALLGNATILEELRGEDGSTGQKLGRTVDMKNLANVKMLKESVSLALEHNPVWRGHILRILDEIGKEFPKSEIEMWIFNPCTGVFTIYNALTKDAGILYIPTYHIVVKTPEVVRMYFGALEDCSSGLTFPKVLDKYYGGSLEGLLLTMSWGGTDTRDSDIIEDLGAQYRSYYTDISDENQNESFFVLRDEKWRHTEPCTPFDLFAEYAENHRALIRHIVRKIKPCDKGSFFDGYGNDAKLKRYEDLAKAKAESCYYSGAPNACHICKCLFEDETYMVDGEMGSSDAWACMCADCFSAYGGEIRWGHGQLYKRDTKGWLLVGGFPL